MSTGLRLARPQNNKLHWYKVAMQQKAMRFAERQTPTWVELMASICMEGVSPAREQKNHSESKHAPEGAALHSAFTQGSCVKLNHARQVLTNLPCKVAPI